MNKAEIPTTLRVQRQVGTLVASITTSRFRFARNLGRFAYTKPMGAIGGVLMLMMVVLALTAPWVSPFNPLETHYDDILLRPQWKYLLGTDNFGRDVLSRLIAGTRSALYVSMVSIGIGVTAGGVLGLVSAFQGGWIDSITQRIMDGLLSFPTLVLALAIVALLGPHDINVIAAIAVVNAPVANRVLRSVTLSIKEEVYVEAARATGASARRVMFRHILPNVLAPYLIVVTGQLASAIIAAASLSFLGVAAPPPEPSWGRMLSEGVRGFAERAPWLVVFPGIFISVTVFGFNMLGDAIRDILDPRLRGR